MNIFYPRSLISLIIIISHIKIKKIAKKKNILILEKEVFTNFLKILPKKKFILKYFRSIEVVSTPKIDHKIFRYNYFKLYFYISDKIKHVKNNPKIQKILKIKFNNFYGGGTYLDSVFYKQNKGANFYFVEHGIGNIITFYKLNIIKLKISYLIKFF